MMKLLLLLLLIAILHQQNVTALQQSNETCDALDRLIASGTGVGWCSKNQLCTGINCQDGGDYSTFNVTFSHCTNPATMDYKFTIVSRTSFGEVTSSKSGRTTNANTMIALSSNSALNLRFRNTRNGVNFGLLRTEQSSSETLFQDTDIPFRCNSGRKMQAVASVMLIFAIFSAITFF